MKNPLSEIYANRILVSEKQDNVVADVKDLKITSGNVIPSAKNDGSAKVKKDVEEPEEDKAFSDGEKAKLHPVKENAEERSSFEGAFERLFKATLNEEEMPEMSDMPASEEELEDESSEEEVSDLASDLKDIIGKLQSILDKVSDSSESEENKDFELEEESASEENVEEEPESEDSVKEAVEAEEHGHALVNAKSGKDLVNKAKNVIKGAVKTTTGKATAGDVTSEPEPKELGKTEDMHNPKKKPEPNSSVKVGDFFK